MINLILLRRGLVLACCCCVWATAGAARAALPEIVVTNDLVLEAGAKLSTRLIVRASHVTIDGAGATLVGPGKAGEVASLEDAGIGVVMEGTSGVTLKNRFR